MKNSKKYLGRAFAFALCALSMQTYAQNTQNTQNTQINQMAKINPIKEPHQSNHFQNLDANNYASLQKEASAIVLVKADWCSTCKSQMKNLEALKKDARYQNTKFFIVDYDQQKNILKTMKVNSQSTIIALKKGQEMARIVALDSAVELKKLLDKSL